MNKHRTEKDEAFLNSLSLKSRALWNGVRAGIAITAASTVTIILSIQEVGGDFTGLEKAGLGGFIGGIALASSAAAAYIPSSTRDALAAKESAE